VSEGLGGFGNGTTNRTMIVAGDKSRSEDEFTYTGRFKTLAGGGKPRTTIAITRIDKEVLWNLDPEKKQYTELTFAQLREQMEAGLAAADKSSKDAQPKDADMTFTADVKRTGARETVNGFAAEQVVLTVVGKPKHPEKGAESAEFRMVMDEWLTKNATGSGEMTAYYKLFAEKMGASMDMAGVNAMAQQMYGGAMKELAAKMKDLGGFPVRSTFTIEGSSAMAEAQKQSAQARGKSAEELKAERQKEKEQAAAEEKRQDQEDAKDVASSAATGGSIKGRIGGFLGRKVAGAAQKKVEDKAEKKSEEMASQDSGATAGGPLMKVVTDVVSISTAPAPAGSFDIPAGFKLLKTK
jgi:hypothetical protein